MTIVEPQNLLGVPRTVSVTTNADFLEQNSDTWNSESPKIEDPLHQTFVSTQTTSFYHPSPHPYAQPPGWAASMMQHNGGGGGPSDQRYGLPSGMDYASAAAATMGHHPHAHHPSPSTHPGLATLDPHAHYGLQPAPHHPAGIHPAHVPGGNSLNSKRNADSAGLDMMGQSGAGSSDEDDGSMDIKPSLSERGRGTPLKSPGSDSASKKTRGRVKIKMEFIDNKLRRYTTFSKRKTGIMKKAYELSTLTGTQVMLLVASETGHVYTFATRKLQPMITSDAGKALIQTCLNSPDPPGQSVVASNDQRMSATGFEETELTYNVADDVAAAAEQQQKESDLEIIDEEEEEDYSQYVEEGESEDEADPVDIDDVEPSTEDSISITQVKKYRSRKTKNYLNPISRNIEIQDDEDEPNIIRYGEEEELRIATISTKMVDSDSDTYLLEENPSTSVGMQYTPNRKQRKKKEKPKPNIVTIQPVISKAMPSNLSAPESSHSTTITALPSTIMAAVPPGMVIVPTRPSISRSNPLLFGSLPSQTQPNVAYSFLPSQLPNLAQTLLVGGHMVKQEGRTITLQHPSTSSIIVPGPIITTHSLSQAHPNLSLSLPTTSSGLQPTFSSSTATQPTQFKAKKKRKK